MAWTAPRTWVTGETVTAALLNTHLRDNLLALVPLANGVSVTTFTPTASQSGALTLSTATGRYFQLGKWVFGTVDITINSSGTGGNPIVVGALPVVSVAAGGPAAHGYYFDASASIYTLSCYWNSTTALYLLATTSTFASTFGVTPAVTAVATDQIHLTFGYEAA